MRRVLPLSHGLAPALARSGAFALACGLVLLAASPARAATVVLLHARGAVFEKAAAGFRGTHAPALDMTVDPGPNPVLAAKVRAAKPDVIAAVGADAAQFAETNLPDVPRVVALADDDGTTATAPVVRVDSRIPPSVQLHWIADVLPDVQNVGIVFDPSASQKLVDQFSAAAAQEKRKSRKLAIVPIAVHSEGEIPVAFHQKLPAIQALLFIPDATVLTRDTLLYLLKECVGAGIPAIGFNSGWFIENGAVLALEPEYEDLGKQAADAAAKLAEDHESAEVPPDRIAVSVNRTVAEKLGLRTDYDPDKVKEFQR